MSATKVTIPGWIHQIVDTSPDNPPKFLFFNFKANSDTCVALAEYTLETEINTSRDDMIQAAVGAIKTRQAELLEHYLGEKQQLDDKLNKLLALPSPKAFSADSVGGAEDDTSPEPHNDGFAPNETSFG